MAEAETAPALNPSGLTHRETVKIVAGVLLPVFMGAMTQTIVASALPTIGDELGGKSQLSWVVTAYLLTATASVPLYGKISDIYGRRITLLAAIVIFLAGTIACAISGSMLMLILSRGLQGIGAGGLMSVPVTVLGDVATPRQRAKYYTYFAASYITAGAVGPLLGGLFAQYIHWSAIFWFNLPLGVFAFALCERLLRRLPRNERRHELDILGAVLIVLASSSFMYILNAGGSEYAWASPQIVGLSVLSTLLWAAFIVRLLRFREPLIPPGVIRNPVLRDSAMAHSFGWGAIIGLNIYLPLYLQAVVGMTPANSGLALMGFMAMVNAGALLGAQLTARLTHYKRPAIIGQGVAILATLWLAFRSAEMGVWEFQIVMALIGLGFGPTAPLTTVTVQNAVPTHQLGISLGTMAFIRGMINAMLVAAYGVVALHGLDGIDLAGQSARTAGAAALADRGNVAEAFRLVFLMAVACFLVAFVYLFRLEERPLTNERSTH